MNKITIERTLYETTGDIKDINTLLIPRAELAQASEPEQVHQLVKYRHEKGDVWFNQYAKDPLPVWAVDVQPYVVEPAPVQDSQPLAYLRPMTFDDGRQGWYVHTPEIYCDIEQDTTGEWSVFFRDKHGREGFAEKPSESAALIIANEKLALVAANAVKDMGNAYAERDALKADADRYQILRDDKYQQHEDDVSVSDSSFNTYFGDELDAAVDVLKARYDAMKETP